MTCTGERGKPRDSRWPCGLTVLERRRPTLAGEGGEKTESVTSQPGQLWQRRRPRATPTAHHRALSSSTNRGTLPCQRGHVHGLWFFLLTPEGPPICVCGVVWWQVPLTASTLPGGSSAPGGH